MDRKIERDLKNVQLEPAAVGCGPGTETRTLFCTAAASETLVRAWIAQTKPQRAKSEGHGNVVVNAHLSRGVPPTAQMCTFLARAARGNVGIDGSSARLHGGMRLVYSPAIAGLARMVAVEGVALQLSLRMVMPDDVTAQQRAHSVKDLKDALDRLGDFAPLLEYDGPYAWPGGRLQASRINAVAVAISERAAAMKTELEVADAKLEDASKADRAGRPHMMYSRTDPVQWRLMSESAFKLRLKMEMQRLLHRLSMEVVMLSTYKVLWIAAAEQVHQWMLDRIEGHRITSTLSTRYVKSDGQVLDVAEELKTLLADVLLGPGSENLRPDDWVRDATDVAMTLSGDLSSADTAGDKADLLEEGYVKDSVFRLKVYRSFVESVLDYTENYLIDYMTCANPADALDAPRGNTEFDRSLFLTGFDQPSRPDDAFSLSGPLVSGLKNTPGSVRTMMQKIKKQRRLAEHGSDERRIFDEGMRALQRKYGKPLLTVAHDTPTRADHPVSGVAPHSGEPFGLFAPRATRRSLAWQRWALLSDSAVMSGAVATFCHSSYTDLVRKSMTNVPFDERGHGVPVNVDYVDREQHSRLMKEVARTMKSVMEMMNADLPPGPDGQSPMIQSMEHVVLCLGPTVRALPKPHSRHKRQVHRVLSATIPPWAILNMLGYQEATQQQKDDLEFEVRSVLNLEGASTAAAAFDPLDVIDAVAGGADWNELKETFSLSIKQADQLVQKMVSVDGWLSKTLAGAIRRPTRIVKRSTEKARRVVTELFHIMQQTTSYTPTREQTRVAVTGTGAPDWSSVPHRIATAREAASTRYLMLLPEALVQLMMEDYKDDKPVSSHRQGTPMLALHGTLVIPRVHPAWASVDEFANVHRPGLAYAWRWSGAYSARNSAEERRDPFNQLEADTQREVAIAWERWNTSGQDLAVNHHVFKQSSDHDKHVEAVQKELGANPDSTLHQSFDAGQEQICTYAALEDIDVLYGARMRIQRISVGDQEKRYGVAGLVANQRSDGGGATEPSADEKAETHHSLGSFRIVVAQ